MVAKARRNLRNLTNAIKGNLFGSWELINPNDLPDDSPEELNHCMAPTETDEIIRTLESFGIYASVEDYYLGAAVTTYQLNLPKGFKMTRLTRNLEDIARDLGVRAVMVNPSCHGKVGIEIDNSKKLTVSFKELLSCMPRHDNKIPVILGENTLGNPQFTDITELPHLLVAGATGSGKSVFLHSLICSILATRMPDQVQLMMVDPKQVEFQGYRNVPHLKENIACNQKDAGYLLDTAIDIMEDRFNKLTRNNARNISEYANKTGDDLPYIVVIIDEYADLMLMGSTKERKTVEQKIARIAQKARAVGIHLVLATQKPLTTVVTSVIKANLQSRAAFSVASGTDSRVILDQKGAELLSGQGDMLFKNGAGHMTRIQAPWMSDKIIKSITRNRV